MTLAFVFSQGFRPMFLLAGLWGALSVPLWLLAFAGAADGAAAYGDRYWHGHELIFGYAAAAIGGFLLTAIPNWTGRRPVGGWLLGVLVASWLAGRAAMLAGHGAGWLPAAVDLAYLPLLMLIAGREIVLGRNWRNLVVLIFPGLLLAANVWFHWALIEGGAAPVALRFAIATVSLLIAFIGGRITPAFTRNWLVKQGATRLPPQFGWVDRVALIACVPAFVAWVAAPSSPLTGALALIAGCALTVRLARWRGLATLPEPLLAVLHAGYAFIPLGFLLAAAHGFGLTVTVDSALHAWTAGAIGTMTLAVMTRATLGHSGRPLVATPATVAVYGAMLLAGWLRLCAQFFPGAYLPLLEFAAALWTVALLGFAATYGPLMLKPTVADEPSRPAVAVRTPRKS